jgi:hypothetical protein
VLFHALTIHIAKDKSTDITTISSALHKRMETSVPVAESISGDDDRPLTPMDVDGYSMMTRFCSKKIMNKQEPVSTYKHMCVTDVLI